MIAFSPNLLHLIIPSSAHIKFRTWLGFNSILDFVCAVKMSWISPINASFSFWALDLVIGPLGICKASFELIICAGAWGWLNFSSWFSSFSLFLFAYLFFFSHFFCSLALFSLSIFFLSSHTSLGDKGTGVTFRSLCIKEYLLEYPSWLALLSNCQGLPRSIWTASIGTTLHKAESW